jgi:hypothetical protein
MAHDDEPMLTALRALGHVPPRAPLPSTGLTLKLVPREDGLQEKAIPVDALKHKLTMMRDKLRVMEQRMNASDNLDVDERAKLQALVTSTYAAIAGLVALFSEEALPASDVASEQPTQVNA